jgi:hypothetical protein
LGTSVVNRYYDPATDQFMSIDPDVDATDQPYVYVGDNPLNETDPMGLKGWYCILGQTHYYKGNEYGKVGNGKCTTSSGVGVPLPAKTTNHSGAKQGSGTQGKGTAGEAGNALGAAGDGIGSAGNATGNGGLAGLGDGLGFVSGGITMYANSGSSEGSGQQLGTAIGAGVGGTVGGELGAAAGGGAGLACGPLLEVCSPAGAFFGGVAGAAMGAFVGGALGGEAGKTLEGIYRTVTSW